MATAVPARLKSNSNGSSLPPESSHRPSLASFPSSAQQRVNSNSLSPPSGHRRNLTTPTAPPSARSHSSLAQNLHSAQHGPMLRSPGRRGGQKSKPVKSQYPRNSPDRHVEYILVASFDIDRGSIMEHQYPGPVGGDEHMLAELMLPDQTHVRSQDWTIFFLHKDAGLEEEEQEARRQRRRRRRKRLGELVEAGASEDETELGGEDGDELDDIDDDNDDDESEIGLDAISDGPPLVYVLNLVNTKQDKTVKRGAVVKAMAICTRHSFLHIYKPLLLLALEQYFAHPQVETLASLYEAVNSMDLSLMPKLNPVEKFILQATEAKDLFLEKFEAMIAQRVQSSRDQPSSTLALLEPSTSGQVQARARYGLPRDTHEFESIVHYANVPVPVKVPTAVSAETVGDFSLIKLITTFSTPHSTSAVPFSPTHPHLTTAGPLTHPMIVLLNALLTQKRIIFLGHNLPSSEVAEAVLGACALGSGGMLRGFTRHAFPYTDLTKIDDLLKVPGFIAGVTNPAFAHKSEWWDVLCDLSTGRMRISNRIEQAPLTEGVVYFQQNAHAASSHGQTGAQAGIGALVTAGASLSAGLGGNTATTGSNSGDATGDAAFMQSVLAAINERHGENAIRSKFRKWIVKFTRLSASFEELVYGASALHIHNPSDAPRTPFSETDSPIGDGGPRSAHKPSHAADEPLPSEVTGHGYVWATMAGRNAELAANATRIEGWRSTRSYYNYIQDLAVTYVHRPVKTLDLVHLHEKLAKLRLGPDQAANVYLALAAAVHTDDELCLLISIIANGVWEQHYLTGGGGGGRGGTVGGASSVGGSQGLLYIGMGLFHPRQDVREEVAELLARVREHEAGRHFWATLGRFVRIAWERVMVARMERLQAAGADDV